MPDLLAELSAYDLAFLRNIAGLWGVTPSAQDRRGYAAELSRSLLDEKLFRDVYAALGQPLKEALGTLKNHDGHLPWAEFTRLHGQLRPMGPGKRAREKPHLFPENISENLWYRGLIGRDFVRQEDGELREIAYVPDEFLAWLPEHDPERHTARKEIIVPVAPNGLRAVGQRADRVLDDTCTLLAALRLERGKTYLDKANPSREYWQVLNSLLQALGLVGKDRQPIEAARTFLELPRVNSLTWLAQNWAVSRKFNELRLVPGLRCEGTWRNDPLAPRKKILQHLEQLPPGSWVSVDVFIGQVWAISPDFLRQDADYDTWMICNEAPGSPLLRGRESWTEVEGAYLRFLLGDLMPWLGLLELAASVPGQDDTWFRKSAWLTALQADSTLPGLESEDSKVTVTVGGELEMNHLAPRIARYQLSRFGEWLEAGPARYRYQLTPSSLQSAAARGLTPRHLLSLLRKYGRGNPPPVLVRAISRWEAQGREAALERLNVLRLGSAEMLAALRESEAARFLGESLGPAVVIVKAGGEEKVRAALARLGYLADVESAENQDD